jgi:hypothetical protein
MNCRDRVGISRFHVSAILAAALSLASASAPGSTVISCAFGASAGDRADRGIVVPGYAGTNIRLVQLNYRGVAGTYRVTLTIRRSTYDGPLVGSPVVAYVTLSGGGAAVTASFDFGGAPVTPGDTLTLAQTYSGPGTLFFDKPASACAGVYETEGTSPPLDTFRDDRVGIVIAQDDLAGACIPSDTVLCIDRTPGDRRYKVTLNFSHAGGPSGAGQAIPMASLGVAHGGGFWFFSQDNPEMLVKVVNGCAFNNRYWVFATAGTNLAFTLNVLDTVIGVNKSYTNPDNSAAQPVQDTSAFATCP